MKVLSGVHAEGSMSQADLVQAGETKKIAGTWAGDFERRIKALVTGSFAPDGAQPPLAAQASTSGLARHRLKKLLKLLAEAQIVAHRATTEKSIYYF